MCHFIPTYHCLRNIHKESLNKNLSATASSVDCLTCPVPIIKKKTPPPAPELPNIKVIPVPTIPFMQFIFSSVARQCPAPRPASGDPRGRGGGRGQGRQVGLDEGGRGRGRHQVQALHLLVTRNIGMELYVYFMQRV